MSPVTRWVVALVLLVAVQPLRAQTVISFHTGNAPLGQRDLDVWIQGNWATGITDPRPGLTGANFALQHPFVIRPLAGVWADPITGDQYVGPSVDGVGGRGGWEYYVEFSLPADVSSASLDLRWHGDDAAYPNVNGEYIGYGYGTGHGSLPAQQVFDVTSLMHPGKNRLSLFVENAYTGTDTNPTGVDFAGAVTYKTSNAVPEPAYVQLAVLVGLAGLGTLRARRRNRA